MTIRIPNYTIVRPLGEGGMGTVFLARQTAPVRRDVAIKVVKAGMASPEVVARFLAERQALALMSHPGIAQVYEAGATDDGRPYLAMELITGSPITSYCDEHKLPLRDRLELFIDVCHAVQHAHQKGILHRDLKPSNVLVGGPSQQPAVKIIDFGLAKAADRASDRASGLTEMGQLVGSIEYMSPEQADLTNADADVRSDVYALGSILYELLTSDPPLSQGRIRNEALDQLLDAIRTERPASPSARIAELPESSEAYSNRNDSRRRLIQTVRGDLDLITMKALEKSPDRRYGTAAAVAADLRRWLAREPIEARPASVGYRARTFARKYRKAATVAVCFVALLLITTAVSAWQSVRAARAERRALNEQDIATAVNNFLIRDVLGQADPANSPDRDLPLKTVLDEAAASVDEHSDMRPLVEAGILYTLGLAYRSIEEYGAAAAMLERSWEIRRDQLGSQHESAIATANSLIELFHAWGRPEEVRSWREHATP